MIAAPTGFPPVVKVMFAGTRVEKSIFSEKNIPINALIGTLVALFAGPEADVSKVGAVVSMVIAWVVSAPAKVGELTEVAMPFVAMPRVKALLFVTPLVSDFNTT